MVCLKKPESFRGRFCDYAGITSRIFGIVQKSFRPSLLVDLGQEPASVLVLPLHNSNHLQWLRANVNVLGVPEQCVLLLADLDGTAAELRNEDLVAGLDAHGHALAVLVGETGANGEDLALVELLDSAVGEEDARGSLGLGLDALHQNAVKERCEGLDVLEERLGGG